MIGNRANTKLLGYSRVQVLSLIKPLTAVVLNVLIKQWRTWGKRSQPFFLIE